MQYKTQLNTDELLTALKSSVDFWTLTIQDFCFKRVRKVRTVNIFEFVLQLAKNRSDGAQVMLDKMCLDNDMAPDHIFASSMCEARDKVVIDMWKQILVDLSASLGREIKTRR